LSIVDHILIFFEQPMIVLHKLKKSQIFMPFRSSLPGAMRRCLGFAGASGCPTGPRDITTRGATEKTLL
jgi:hypothetical protein